MIREGKLGKKLVEQSDGEPKRIQPQETKQGKEKKKKDENKMSR